MGPGWGVCATPCPDHKPVCLCSDRGPVSRLSSAAGPTGQRQGKRGVWGMCGVCVHVCVHVHACICRDNRMLCHSPILFSLGRVSDKIWSYTGSQHILSNPPDSAHTPPPLRHQPLSLIALGYVSTQLFT